MRFAAGCPLIFVVLVGAGCASKPVELVFTKSGATPEQTAADSAACWKHATDTPEGRKTAEMVNGGRLLGGGLAAAANMEAEKAAYGNDPKANLGNWTAHRVCMQDKGYIGKMAGW